MINLRASVKWLWCLTESLSLAGMPRQNETAQKMDGAEDHAITRRGTPL